MLSRAWLLPVVIMLPAARGEILSNHDLRVINRVVQDGDNVVFAVKDFRLEGFVDEVDAFYRLPSVRRVARQASIRVTAPRAGRFYPCVVVYDASGRERFAIYVSGRLLGEATADWDNLRQRLFFSAEPVELRGGEEVEVRAVGDSGHHRVENVLLLRQRPEAQDFSYEFRDVRWHANTLTWRTNWATACVLEFDGRRIRESSAQNNHRVIVEDVKPGREYRYRITAPRFDGKMASTGWRTLRIAPETTAPRGGQRGWVPLKVELPGRPVTAGVPFPKGALASDAHLRLLDLGGREIALQTRTLARWEDGSVKWVLLDFKTRKSDATVRLEYGPDVVRRSAEQQVSVMNDHHGVTVDAGAVAFRIDGRRFGFLEWIRAGGARLSSPVGRSAFYLTDAAGTVYDSLGPPEEIVIEDRGPVRAAVRVSGRHRSAQGRALFRYVVRFHVWAGEPVIRVQHTFENDSLAEEFCEIQSLVLRLPLVGVSRRTEEVRVRRDTERKAGVVRWQDGDRTVTLAVRDFWQNYPKDLAARENGLELAICPRLMPEEYASARGTVDEHRLFFFLRRGKYRFRQGMSKTHEFWIALGEQEPELVPSMAAAPAAWYAESKAMGRLAPPTGKGYAARYDAAFERAFRAYLERRETDHAYGMLNFGDWWGEREVNWGNCEYDTQHSLFLQFLRTGDWRYFRVGEQAEWHNRDVDVAHHHANPLRRGGVWEHKVGHTGGYFPGHRIAEMAEDGDMTASHTFVEGHFDYYFLTGDSRSLDTARRLADLYCGPLGRNFELISARHGGWLMTLAMAAYNATADPYYLNFAHIIFERVLELNTPDGGWSRKLTRYHCNCLPRHIGEAGFMVGVLTSGLLRYYEAVGDERAAEAVIRAARFVVEDMWMPEQQAFRYTSCPRTGPSSASGLLLLEALAFASARTSDPRLAEPLRLSIERGLRLLDGGVGFGKIFSQATRQMPRVVDVEIPRPSDGLAPN